MNRSRRRWLAAGAAILTGLTFVAVDPPGVEKVVDPLDADSAVAGRQYKVHCTTASNFYLSKRGGRVSSWQPTRALARQSAIIRALGGGVRISESWATGEITVYKNGREVGVIPRPRCSDHSSRRYP